MSERSGIGETAFAAHGGRPSSELRACLDRIERHEPRVRAFTVLAVESALASAADSDRRWAAGRPLSEIDGMVIGLKDLIETADMPTGQGSPLWAGFETRRDGACVQALRDAGAIILGKTTTTEFAFAQVFHHTTNPHDPTRTPGGSSSGSAAAVGAGFIHAGMATQVLGSILRPASFCGCVGFKPSFGAVNRGGAYDHLSQSCLGVIGRSIGETWAVAASISERVGGDPGRLGLTGPASPPPPRKPRTLAVLHGDGWRTASDEAKAAFEAACARLREAGVVLTGREADPALDAFEEALEGVEPRVRALLDWEMRWPVGSYRRQDASRVSQGMLERLEASEARMGLADYHALLAWRDELRARYARFAGAYDGLVALSATGAAPVGLGWTGDPAMNVPASTLGVPAAGLPVLGDGGAPLGLQFIGFAHQDRALMELAEWAWRLFGTPFRMAGL